jgi:hypothetical protein
MKKQNDYEKRRQREEDLKKHPGKAPGHEKLPEPEKIPRPPESTPPEIRKPTRPDVRDHPDRGR